MIRKPISRQVPSTECREQQAGAAQQRDQRKLGWHGREQQTMTFLPPDKVVLTPPAMPVMVAVQSKAAVSFMHTTRPRSPGRNPDQSALPSGR
jgi:hypothetical protein